MPLPIEVTHVLGKRSLTLAYRTVDAPVVVGRGRECDVQIPSVSVGTAHCMLFVHEGRWLLQESPDAVVTVNGQPITGPVMMRIGDVIGVGAGEKAPTIQINPAAAAAGKTGPALEAIPVGGASTSAGSGAGAPSRVRPPKPKPIAGAAPPQLTPPPPPISAEPEPEYEFEPVAHSYPEEFPIAEPDGDTIDLGLSAGASAPTYRRRTPKQNTGMGMVVLFLVVIAGGAAVIAWAWKSHQAMLAANTVPPPPPPAPVAIAVTEPDTQPVTLDPYRSGIHSIFQVPGSKPKPPAPPPPAPEAPADAPPASGDTTAPADMTDGIDDDSDPAWVEVKTAHISPDQANAIIKYDSYHLLNIGKHTKQLADFETEALEHLWRQRTLDLFEKRADLDTQIEKQKTDMADQPPGDFHKKMEADLADLNRQRAAADHALTVDMEYTLPTAPDIDDPQAMTDLDAKRDAAKFDTWKKNTLDWIREHNGRPPWADE